jgi:FkbH-like protein
VPFEHFRIKDRQGHVLLYPETTVAGISEPESNGSGALRTKASSPVAAEPEKRLIFTWLDFVRYAAGRRAGVAGPRPADKVKCVAWDLDNTVWRGILAETAEPSSLEARREALELMRALDERGVIQTVVSKNTHDEAWEVLTRLGIQDYFVYPAINWGAKSENLKAVAERINIDLNTFALIDDSAFERGEVKTALPQVRVYADTEMTGLLRLPELDLPITEASRIRRLSYLAEMRRETIQASFQGTYDDFIASCEMKLRIFEPVAEGELLRCWELVQRSNQLNLSSRRYALPEFKALVADPAVFGLAFECGDRFGEYGIVGFASVADTGPSATLVDFVLSCRVAQKKVEYTFFKWLAQELRGLGKGELLANLVVTKKNKPLRQVFSELPFQVLEQTEATLRLRLDLSEPTVGRDLLAVSADGLRGRRGSPG